MVMKNRALRDRYGFLFWLKWILWFAGSFVAAAVVWTTLFKFSFGKIEGAELTLSWVVAVFGSWFLLVIPFMRKKEQIWKRLNEDQEKAVDASFLGMGIFIGLLIASSFGWSLVFKHRLNEGPGLEPVWAKAVFGTWLATLIPFLILLYRKADQIFKDAVIRQGDVPVFKSIFVKTSRRTLPKALEDKLKTFPPTLGSGHLVTLTLKDGRKVPHVFVIHSKEILGVYDPLGEHALGNLSWLGQIEAIEETKPADWPDFQESQWLRLDREA
jgi:hypothetical protein